MSVNKGTWKKKICNSKTDQISIIKMRHYVTDFSQRQSPFYLQKEEAHHILNACNMSSILKKRAVTGAWWFCSSPRKDQSSRVLCRLLCAAILQTMCQWGIDKQRNKGQDIVSVNEANFKGSSEAFLKCFTEPGCFSNHKKSSLTKSGKTAQTTLK